VGDFRVALFVDGCLFLAAAVLALTLPEAADLGTGDQ
jgi:hypothetical protein